MHSIEHGKQVARTYYQQTFYQKYLTKNAAGKQRKRKLEASDFQVMCGPHVSPEEQQGRLEFLEVQLQPGDGDLACVTYLQ